MQKITLSPNNGSLNDNVSFDAMKCCINDIAANLFKRRQRGVKAKNPEHTSVRGFNI